ncbi:hypothetical protein BWI93_13890 [Siphonobacter sp. BAB-5385]|uniref:DUF3817 domain-containing protein n=1 Tax=Siphonobacter sp. BAB-5385 TaxID=1864822 RepID=UPI000B9DF955|nr:DUF3817 domain-containing protein [Siphonobacter sp. BAB-5385]OZI07586.1 hypothetical protein BWI93_13890 [Siphonobacter sp. BAB-5385]
MQNLFSSSVGRLRVLGFLEGISLLVLVLVAVPLKYYAQNPALTKLIGPIHGGLFLLFVINTLSVGIEQNWRFKTTTWKVLLACVVPFGTFYVDRYILSRIPMKS